MIWLGLRDMKKLSPLLNDVNKTAIIVDCLLKSSLYAYHAKHILSFETGSV